MSTKAWRLWGRIAAVTAVAGSVGYVATFLLPPLYQSQLVLYFPQSQGRPPSGPLSSLQPTAMGDVTDIRLLQGAYISRLVGANEAIAMGILQSRTCLEEVIRNRGLLDRWNLPMSKALEEFRSRLSVEQEKSGFVSVTVTMQSPRLAQQVVNDLYAHLARRSEELTVNIGTRNRKDVEARLREAERNLQTAQQRLQAAMASSPAANVEETQKVYFESYTRLAEAQAQAAGARATIAELERGLKELSQHSGDFPGSVVALGQRESAFSKLVEELIRRRQDLADAQATFTAKSPEYGQALRAARSIESVTTSIAEKQREFAAKGLLPVQAEAKAQLVAFEGQIATLDRVLKRFYALLIGSPKHYVAVQTMKSQFEDALQRVGQLRADLEAAKIAESRDPARFEVVDEPIEDPYPVSPRRARIAGLVALAALLIQLWPIGVRWAQSSASRNAQDVII
jgi:uncharacterized protein involved in exopolysaccharide biosynthesis